MNRIIYYTNMYMDVPVSVLPCNFLLVSNKMGLIRHRKLSIFLFGLLRYAML